MARWIAVLAVMTMIAAACGDSHVTTTTTPPPPDGHSCYYQDGYIVAAPPAVLSDPQEDANTPARFAPADLELLGVDEGAAAFLNIYEIKDGSDPLGLALELNAAGQPASPVFAVGFAPHWSAAPGDDPQQAATVTLPAFQAPTRTVAVIDSGLAASGDDGLDMRVGGDQEMVASRNAGHGTFVASLIVQASAGAAGIEMVALPRDSQVLQPTDPDEAVDDLSTELEVLTAVSSLVSDGTAADVLNLSFGVYECADFAYTSGAIGSSPFPTLGAAIQLWKTRDGGPVVAAGGNIAPSAPLDTGAPFWPAAFPDVECAVTAGLPDGTAIVFDDAKDPVELAQTTAGHQWTNVVAPGWFLVGYGPNGQPTRWSGSSFAAAVVSGLVAVDGHRALCPKDPDASTENVAPVKAQAKTVVTSDMVPGLNYEQGGNLVVTP